LWIIEGAESLWARWTYSADLFQEERVVGMHGHFETLLSNIVARPDALLDKIEMLSEAERAQQDQKRIIHEKYNYNRFKSVEPRAVALSED
jgi:hypothetical protein